MKSQTKYQGGSVVSFAVVAVVLAIVLIAGLYGLQRYGQSIDNANKEVARETTDDDDTSNKTKNDDSKDDNKSNTSKSDDSQTPSEPEPVVSTDEEDDQADANEQLPSTGPSDTMLQLIAVSAITFAGVSYLRSRQAL